MSVQSATASQWCRRLLGVMGAAAAVVVLSTTAARAAQAPVTVTGVRLETSHDATGSYTYTATVVDANGIAVQGASLDIGGLAADPDIRLPTTDMTVTKDPTQYSATVRFPSKGDWMLVVRVHEPTQLVDVFTERIDAAPIAGSHHDLASNPAKRAVLADDPTFYDRYNPYNPVPGTSTGSPGSTVGVTDAAHPHGGGVVAGEATVAHGFDFSVTALVVLHSAAAVAWLLSVGILALANRFGPGSGRNEAIHFVSQRYRLLAGGGMLAAVLTGVVMAQKASAGVLHPSRLLASPLGTAYLAVFAVKLLLVTVSLVTTLRLGRILAPRSAILRRPVLASLGAAADDGPDRRVLVLAELNLVSAALIMACVAVLGQLHHALL